RRHAAARRVHPRRAEGGHAYGDRGQADLLCRRHALRDDWQRRRAGEGRRRLPRDDRQDGDVLQGERAAHRRRQRGGAHADADEDGGCHGVPGGPPPVMSTLRTHELTKSYGGRTVVRGVSLDVQSGEVVGLLGPNGAGKTTTFYMTVGLTAPDS